MSEDDLALLKAYLTDITNQYEYSSPFVTADGPINETLYYDYATNQTICLRSSGRDNTINTSPNVNEILKIVDKYID